MYVLLHAGPGLPLGELGGCLGRWAKRGTKKGPKLCNCVVQKVMNLHQA